MTSSWVWLALAAVMLWVPLASTLLIRKHKSSRRLSYAPSARGLLVYWPNWVDLIRCLLAMALLVGWGDALREEDPSSGKIVLGFTVVVVVVGYLLQAMLVATRRTFFVALPISIATAIVIPEPEVGLFAIIVSFLFAVVSKKLDLLIPILSGVLAVGGAVLGANQLDLVAAVFLVFFPQLLAVVFARQAILPSNVVLSHQ